MCAKAKSQVPDWQNWRFEGLGKSNSPVRGRGGYAISRGDRDSLWKANQKDVIEKKVRPREEELQRQRDVGLHQHRGDNLFCALLEEEFTQGKRRLADERERLFKQALRDGRRRAPSLLPDEDDGSTKNGTQGQKTRAPKDQPDDSPDPKPGPDDSPYLEPEDDRLATFEKHDHQWHAVHTSTVLDFRSFPWPSFTSPQTSEDLKIAHIEYYIQYPMFYSDQTQWQLRKSRYRKHLRKWHHDRFETQLLPKVVEHDRMHVKGSRALVISVLLWILRSQPIAELPLGPFQPPYYPLASSNHVIIRGGPASRSTLVGDEESDVGVHSGRSSSHGHGDHGVADMEDMKSTSEQNDTSITQPGLTSVDQESNERVASGHVVNPGEPCPSTGSTERLHEDLPPEAEVSARRVVENGSPKEDGDMGQAEETTETPDDTVQSLILPETHTVEGAQRVDNAIAIGESEVAQQPGATQQAEDHARTHEAVTLDPQSAAAHQLLESIVQLGRPASCVEEERPSHVDQAQSQLLDSALRIQDGDDNLCQWDDGLKATQREFYRQDGVSHDIDTMAQAIVQNVANKDDDFDTATVTRIRLGHPWEAVRRPEVEPIEVERNGSPAVGKPLPDIELTIALARYVNVLKAQTYFVLYGESLRRLASFCEAFVNKLEGIATVDPPPYDDIQRWYHGLYIWANKKSALDPVSALANWKVMWGDIETFCKECPEFIRQHVELATGMQVSCKLNFSEILHTLRAAASLREREQHLARLDKADALALVELLDQVLDSVDFRDLKPLRSRCLHMLKHICRHHCILPESAQLPSASLFSLELAGCGGFATVYRGSYEGREVAIKVLQGLDNDENSKRMQRLYTEAILWKHLKHRNITPFHGVTDLTLPSGVTNLTRSCEVVGAIVCEWMSLGTVMSYLRLEQPGVSRIESIIDDVAQGLKYLHDNDIAHGDLKGDNILVSRDLVARLADFGLSGLDPVVALPTTSAEGGSVRWMAPELHEPERWELRKSVVTAQSDVYSFGMTMLQIFTGKAPFNQYDRDSQVMSAVMRGERPLRPDCMVANQVLIDKMWSLMEDCWQGERTKRPDMHNVLARLGGLFQNSSTNTVPN